MSVLTSALVNSGLITAIYGALVALLTIALRGRRRSAFALGLADHAGLFGLAALLAIPIISPFPVDFFRLFGAIAVDLFCVLIFFLAGFRLVTFLRTKAIPIGDQYVVWLLLAKALFFALNYTAAGGQYGIFSDDSRIDFLAISPILSKTRYLDQLIDFVILLSLGLRGATTKRVRGRDLVVVVILNIFGFLTGSKGGTLLTTAYAGLFVFAAFPKSFSLKTRVVLVTSLSVLVCGYVYFLSEILQIKMEELASLSLARFVLSADARLMSFDAEVTRYVLSQPHGTLLAELFRGMARLLNAPVAESSLGMSQFEYELGTTNYVGSTSQLAALFTTYGGAFWLGEMTVVGIVVVLVHRLFATWMRERSSALSWHSAASLYVLSNTLPQSFDGYVQLVPICVLIGVVLWGAQSFTPRRIRRRRPTAITV